MGSSRVHVQYHSNSSSDQRSSVINLGPPRFFRSIEAGRSSKLTAFHLISGERISSLEGPAKRDIGIVSRVDELFIIGRYQAGIVHRSNRSFRSHLSGTPVHRVRLTRIIRRLECVHGIYSECPIGRGKGTKGGMENCARRVHLDVEKFLPVAKLIMKLHAFHKLSLAIN